MKKTDWAVIIGTGSYSLLFYEQNAGLNFLLFNILLIVLFAWSKPELINSKRFIFYSVCCLFSSAFVMIHDSDLAVFSNIVSFVLLSAFCVKSGSSVFINLLQALYSLAGSIVFLFKKLFTPAKNTEPAARQGFKMLIYLFAFCVLLIFFAIYKQANPLFEKYTRFINLDFFSVAWLGFTFCGLIILNGLYKHKRIQEVDDWELLQYRQLAPDPDRLFNPHTRQALTFLFLALNLILLFINSLDVNFLYMGSGLPEGITHKQFVHNGVNMLILSILLGIAIILYAFRQGLNFDDKSRPLKILVYLWLAQNLLMVFSTALRNHMYIIEALLTYKRIGVYYWLLLAVLGLVTTYIKVRNIKPNWYLMRQNSFFAFVILVLSCSVDWDKIISDYNISHNKLISSLDKKYLISISETNIRPLYILRNHPEFETDSVWHYNAAYKNSNRRTLDIKLASFLVASETGDWRSYSIRRARVLKEISILAKAGLIDSLNFTDSHSRNLAALDHLPQLKELTLGPNFIFTSENIHHLKNLAHLEKLQVNHLQATDIKLMRQLQQLKVLTITNKNNSWLKQVQDSLAPMTVR